jgi:hypothetical protein
LLPSSATAGFDVYEEDGTGNEDADDVEDGDD